MENVIVATSQVSNTSALNDQLTSLQFGDPKYYLLQRPDDITDWTEGTPKIATIENFTHGRLFGSQGEIRWQKDTNGFSLLWLSEGELPNGFTQIGDWTTTKPQNIHLLGGGKTKPWRDTRIPSELNYPMDWCKHPCVKVIQYKERNSQTIRFTRYTEFVQKSGD